MISKEEKILHDYFDNLLTTAEQHKFEEDLIDNIDLAIELGKLKNLHRNLRNLTSNFEPGPHVIDNIIDSLLEEKKEKKEAALLEEKESKKEKKARKKKEKKKRKGLKAKTKYRLNQLFTMVLLLLIIASAIGGYLYFQEENTTFPWKISLMDGNISRQNEALLSSGLKDAQTFATSENEKIKLTIPLKAVIEIEEKSKIRVIAGSQQYNSIKFISGKINFIPFVGNEIFDIFINQVTLQSSNSEFEISSLEGKLSEVFVKSNYLKVLLNGNEVKIPFNHFFQIYNSNEISIPTSVNINKTFTRLIEKYSLTKEQNLIPKILKTANRYNAFSLYYLLSEVTPINREKAIKKLSKFFPLPENISEEDILILDNNALQKWWDKIYLEM